MTPQLIIAVTLRFAAIFLVISSLHDLITAINVLLTPEKFHYPGNDPFWRSLTIGAISAIKMITALMFWFFPMMIANRIIPKHAQSQTRTWFSASDALVTGCALMGLWLFVTQLPFVVWHVCEAVTMKGNVSFISSLSPAVKIKFFSSLGELIISLLLIFRAGWFAQLVFKKPVSNANKTVISNDNT